MAVSLPSDIVSDVVRAADPSRVQVAATKLGESPEGISGAQFAEALDKVGLSTPSPGFDPYSYRTNLRSSSALSGGTVPNSPYRKFESFVLQTFVEAMMPKDTSETFGKGTAGGIWKSMMAESLSNEISKAGGIGIATLLEKTTKPVRPVGA
jgi:hypothetical protein